MHERQGHGLGILIQMFEDTPQLVAYFSKQLEPTAKGELPCLTAVAVACDILLEVEKLTLGQEIMVYVPHQVLTHLEQKGGYWLMAGRMS